MLQTFAPSLLVFRTNFLFGRFSDPRARSIILVARGTINDPKIDTCRARDRSTRQKQTEQRIN